MIVRDEARCIERCLRSARPWVDEMVVLDTGSTDATRELAAAGGARVYRQLDRRLRRRAQRALAATEAPWRLVLDADEWIAGGECLAGRAARAEPPAFIGLVTRQQPVRGRRRAAAARRRAGCRACCRRRALRGRIHEQPGEPLPRRRLPLRAAATTATWRSAAGQGRPQRAPAAPGAGRAAGRRLPALPARQGPRAARALRRGRCRSTSRRSARGEPGAAWRHDLVVRLLFTLKKHAPLRRRDRAGRGRDAALAATRPTSSSRSATCCSTGRWPQPAHARRAAADDRVELAARAWPSASGPSCPTACAGAAASSPRTTWRRSTRAWAGRRRRALWRERAAQWRCAASNEPRLK